MIQVQYLTLYKLIYEQRDWHRELWNATTYLACKLLAILLSLLHLQGGFSFRSFKDGASMLPLSALEERDYMKISWPNRLRHLMIHLSLTFSQQWLGVKFVQTLGWPMHGRGVSMYPKDWSPWGRNTVYPVTKEERSNRTVYLVEHIWWCTICLLAG